MSKSNPQNSGRTGNLTSFKKGQSGNPKGKEKESQGER